MLEIEPVNLARKLVWVPLLTACFIWFGLSIVRAQEATPVSPEPVSTTDIQVQPPLTAEINQLKEQYRMELETYRDLERQTDIANKQYVQLKTLVSLETAVTTLKKTMQSRAKVLELYVKLLTLELTNATGVELSSKERLLQLLDSSQSKLGTHLAAVEQANDRDSLTRVSASFEPIGSELEEIAYQTQAQLTISKLQTVYDKVQVVKDEVDQQTAAQTPLLQQPARERAFAETNRNLDQVRDELVALQSGLANQELGRTSYSDILRSADSVYAGIAQSLNFLSELAGIKTND